MQFTPRLNLAVKRAGYAHALQKRKGSGLPYIVHPYAVMLVAAEATDDEDILIGCLLHDVIEDVPDRYSKEEIRRDFGDRVVTLIEGVTKDKTLTTWQESADAYITHLKNVEEGSLIISAADKIHNALSIIEDRAEVGEVIWERFSVGRDQQVWYYTAVYEVLRARIPDSLLVRRLGVLVDELA